MSVAHGGRSTVENFGPYEHKYVSSGSSVTEERFVTKQFFTAFCRLPTELVAIIVIMTDFTLKIPGSL
jgi:hypothetical protein